jgi:hypothetical protein
VIAQQRFIVRLVGQKLEDAAILRLMPIGSSFSYTVEQYGGGEKFAWNEEAECPLL